MSEPIGGAVKAALSPRSYRLPMDRSGFVRRCCPSCKKHFKTHPSMEDGRTLWRALKDQLAHVQPEGFDDGELCFWTCPYCAAPAAADDWLTQSQRRAIHHLASRYSGHVHHAQLEHAQRDARLRPTFMPVPPEAIPTALGREPDDLSAVPLICCGDELKVDPTWEAPIYCPRCAIQHSRPPPQMTVKLQFIDE